MNSYQFPDDSITYSYHALGRVSQVRDKHRLTLTPPRRTTVYTYDRVTGQETVRQVWTDGDQPGGAVGPSERLEHSLDQSTGRVTSTRTLLPTGGVGTQTDYAYDTAGRLKSATAKVLAGITQSSPMTYTYDKTGLLLTESQPNGVTSTYQYDAFGQNTGVTITRDDLSTPPVTEAVPVFSQSFILEPDGQRDRADEARYDANGQNPVTTRIDWTYDALDRLIGERKDKDNDNTFDPGDYSATFALDAAGNRLTKTINNDSDASVDETIIYRYVFAQGDVVNGQSISVGDARIGTLNRNNQLLEEGSDAAGSTRFGYDTNGSQTSKTLAPLTGAPATETYTWDLRNRMRTATVGGVTTTYSYDSNNLRVTSANSSQTTRFVQDVHNPTGYAQVLEERTGSNALAVSYTVGLNQVAMAKPTTTHYYFSDVQGSVRALTDGSGAVTDTTDYEAFGTVIAQTGTSANRYQFAGEYIDPQTSLSDNRARWLRLGQGRFVSVDPRTPEAGDTLNSNLYLYAAGNPLHYNDANGLAASLAETGGSLGILAIALGVSLFVIGNSMKMPQLPSINSFGVVQDAIAFMAQSSAAMSSTAITLLQSNSTVVGKAIDNAYQALARIGRNINRLRNVPIFPVIRSLMPDIYAFNVRALTGNPAWFGLNYNGPNSPATGVNRRTVAAAWGWTMRTAPFWYQLDEFPFASTWQGGTGALGAPVPAVQNLAQGGLLSAMYRISLKGRAGAPFLVVPIPL